MGRAGAPWDERGYLMTWVWVRRWDFQKLPHALDRVHGAALCVCVVPMRFFRLVLLWLSVLLLGLGIRFVDLGSAPMHADEAVGAKITGDRLEGRGYVFDPAHYHGPTLSWFGARVAELSGKTTYNGMDAALLRLVPAACGAAVVLMPLLLRAWISVGAALFAGLFLATSPLLAMYSRIYIHEPVLALFSAAALACAAWWMRTGELRAALCGGLALGLMAATKETFMIPALAWGVGLAAVLPKTQWRRGFAASVGLAVLAFLGVLVAAYGNPFHFFSTYAAYTTDPAHARPLHYYIELLVWPKLHAPQWWSEAGVAMLAIVGAWAAWRGGNPFSKFLLVSVLVQIGVYSVIGYKTPWLMVVPWMQVCVLAGMGAASLVVMPDMGCRLAGAACVAVVVLIQLQQTHAAAFRFPVDARNPMAFVPTSGNVESLARRLRHLRDKSEAFRESPIAVVGSGYWPLPWYLRGAGTVGYYDVPPQDTREFGVVIAMPEQVEETHRLLSGSHGVFYNGLRHEVPLAVFVRHDIRAEEVAVP